MKKLNQVMIVDDDEVSNLFCKIVIDHADFADNVHSCMSGAEAFDYLLESINSNLPVPDLILLDCSIPDMDCYEFLERYHRFGFTRMLNTRICLLSCSVPATDVKAALEYKGVIDYIVKPLSEEALNRLMYKLETPLLRRKLVRGFVYRSHRLGNRL